MVKICHLGSKGSQSPLVLREGHILSAAVSPPHHPPCNCRVLLSQELFFTASKSWAGIHLNLEVKEFIMTLPPWQPFTVKSPTWPWWMYIFTYILMFDWTHVITGCEGSFRLQRPCGFKYWRSMEGICMSSLIGCWGKTSCDHFWFYSFPFFLHVILIMWLQIEHTRTHTQAEVIARCVNR